MNYKLVLILRFYKPLFAWSMGINILLTLLTPGLAYILIVKLALTLFTWHLMIVTGKQKRIAYFKDFGFSSLALFGYAFLVDIAVTCFYLLLISEFI